MGWVVGHSYSVYGPLLAGCTTLLYEGKPVGTPDAANFWRVIQRHKWVHSVMCSLSRVHLLINYHFHLKCTICPAKTLWQLSVQ